jgi:pyruvate/2-oxoglutarate dehydrogenase complex dihydrolipoamide dehydrogenase (E3) component
VDRAVCEKEEDAGYFKLMYCNHHKLHGATIVCQRAGELINEMALCMHQGIKVRGSLVEMMMELTES